MLDQLNDHFAALAAAGRLAEAAEGLRNLLKVAPTSAAARSNLALVLLAQGRYSEAGPYYEDRHITRKNGRPKPAFPFPEWCGEDVAGKRFLIFPEQGLGDEIMFARFAPHLAKAGADVTLICATPLARLFERCLGVRVRPAHGEVSFPDPDYWSMTNSLLPASGLTPETLPDAPYLWAEPRASGGIGVKVQGSPTHANDANRSLPDDLAAELLALPGAVDLSPEATGATDFHDTAEIVAGLDLVISVDTSIAHLAGAMGRPTWILLPHHATDWRWGRNADTTPWYPSARLFRQGQDGDWRPVVEIVKARLTRPRA